MALVSVILPAYNAEKTIGETIGSVLKQTFSDFELIIINDGSSDNTLQEVEKIRDDRVKVLSFENAGLPVSRNRGIELATGEYITFIDADDLWTQEKLELQIKALEKHPDAGVVYSWTAFIDEKGQYLHAMEPIYFEGNVYKEILQYCFVTSGSNVMIRRKCLESVGLFEPDLKSAADWDYWIRLARNWNFALVPRYQILYRIWPGSMSYDIEAVEADTFRVIDRAFSSAPYELKNLRIKSMALANRYIAFLYVSRYPDTHWKKIARVKILKSIRQYPKSLFNMNTHYVFWTVIFLQFVPTKLSPIIARFLLRLKGGIMKFIIIQLRESRFEPRSK